MRNTSRAPQAVDGIVRATFQVPVELYDAFKTAAKERDQTLSQELRRLMREYVKEDQ